MRRLLQIIAFAVLISCRPDTAPAQATRPETPDVLKQLLALPAPTPRGSGADENTENGPKLQAKEFYDREKMPPDDAPIGDLINYWRWWANQNRPPEVSATVQRRLLEEFSAEPEQVANLLRVFPHDEASAARVKDLYDKSLNNPEIDQESLKRVKKWLVFYSTYFLTELQTMANKVRDNEKGYIDQAPALVALAKVDWAAAEPLVQSLADSGQPRAATLALILLYERAVRDKDLSAEEKLRGRLRAIVANTNAPGLTRGVAIDVLSTAEWSGRDEWYLSLFHDETLINPTDGIHSFSPLGTLIVKDPDKWIPVMAKLVESTDRTVRSAAAGCLIRFQGDTARVDALRPLLPWLSNPDWAFDRFNQRLRLIQSLENVDLPESVPGLIWVVEHDNSEFKSDQSYAAQSLSKYKDARAIPALKKALAAEKREPNRRLILQGLMACGGLPETEQVEALEAYAARLATPDGRTDVMRYRSVEEDPLPLPVSIGMSLSNLREAPDSLLRAVLARADFLRKSNPAVARSLLEVVHGWQGLQVDLDMVQRVADGSADVETIRQALERREKLRESVLPELQALTPGAELAQGLAPVLLEDASLARSVLSSGSESSQIALLACARLAQLPLPVDVVGGRLQSKNQLLAAAAESYLLAEDSRDARELVWARHPKEAFVTGWRENMPLLSSDTYDEMGKFEKQLRDELFKENPPLETIALIANSVEQDGRVLRVYSDRAVYTYYENAVRYRDRVITKEELAAFRQFITTSELANLGPQVTFCHYGCEALELLILTKDKGRRVFSHQGLSRWEDLVTNLDRLGRGENAKIHYHLEKEIKGLEVLYADQQLAVKDVWQGDGGIRIFVERAVPPEELDLQVPNDPEDEQDEAKRAARRLENLARESARFSWRALVNGKADAVTAAPTGFYFFDESRFPGDDELEATDQTTQFIPPDSLIITRNFDGLWRQVAGRKPVQISDDGAYANPIVTPDGKWVVVAKTDGNWGEPNYVARFNLQTGREFRVNLPAADDFSPVAYVASHGRVLLRRARDEDNSSAKAVGPEKPEYYLLDAATGKTELTTGVFEPLRQNGKRFLQPTGKPNEVWAAIPNGATNQTRVGRYNLKDFSFQELLVLPHISFDSMSLWVDEAAAKLFVVYEGQLLRLPLPRAEDAKATKK